MISAIAKAQTTRILAITRQHLSRTLARLSLPCVIFGFIWLMFATWRQGRLNQELQIAVLRAIEADNSHLDSAASRIEDVNKLMLAGADPNAQFASDEDGNLVKETVTGGMREQLAYVYRRMRERSAH